MKRLQDRVDVGIRATPERFVFTRWWWGEAFVLGLCAAVLVLALLADPSSESIRLFGAELPGLCVFKRLTGTPCPGCGLTRSFSYLADGLLWQSLRMHPLGPPFFLAMLYQLPIRAGYMAWGPGWETPWSRWWRGWRGRR